MTKISTGLNLTHIRAVSPHRLYIQPETYQPRGLPIHLQRDIFPSCASRNHQMWRSHHTTTMWENTHESTAVCGNQQPHVPYTRLLWNTRALRMSNHFSCRFVFGMDDLQYEGARAQLPQITVTWNDCFFSSIHKNVEVTAGACQTSPSLGYLGARCCGVSWTDGGLSLGCKISYLCGSPSPWRVYFCCSRLGDNHVLCNLFRGSNLYLCKSL